MSQILEKKLILFVCTGNTCRSPMAAALFNRFNTKPDWEAESAGLAALAGWPASMLAETALMMDYSIDLSSHRSRPVSRILLEKAGWILTMTGAQRDALLRGYPELGKRILTVGEMAGERMVSIGDPIGSSVHQYQDTAARLGALIEKILGKLA
jgi:protein-tyrosine-phosphatase